MSFNGEINPTLVPEAEAEARQPRLSPAKMYAIVAGGDPNYNGRFFTGVLTTGVYCLPSCKARKPKQANVRFFPSVEAARAAGFRPCKKCHPDDFARGSDPVLDLIETLVAEIRACPAEFANAEAIVRRSGFGATRLFELFRQHYHTTPGDLLVRSKIEAAKQKLLATNATLVSISGDSGFEALSAFHENFRRLTGLTPSAYRQLRETRAFAIALPEGYPLPYLLRSLGRDVQSATEELTGNTYRAAIMVAGGPAMLTLKLSKRTATVDISSGSGAEAHAIAVGLLGFEQNAAAFASLARRLGFQRLVAGREALRLSQTPSIFDGLLWSIIGQQITVSFACLLKRRLSERAGIPLGGRWFAPPTVETVAALDRTDLTKLQFSSRKADYLIGLARTVVEKKLDLESLRHCSATRAERALRAVNGLGPWAVNYVMMRSLGLADCLPQGDTGVASGLKALLNLEERPDAETMRRLMAVFSPYRSLATTHLWQFKKPIPL